MPTNPLATAPLSEGDGNIFAVLERASRALIRAGHRDEAVELNDRIFAARSYDEALRIIQEYVEDEADE